jgi:hypothetical protein
VPGSIRPGAPHLRTPDANRTADCRIDYDANDYTATSTFDQSKKNAQPHFDLQNRAQAFSLRGVKDDGGTWQELNYIVLVTKGASKLMPGKSSV